MATKAFLTGRALGIQLTSSSEAVVASLRECGLAGENVESIATAAIACADEETLRLQHHLVPQAAWLGTVVCRRIYSKNESTWLLLKRIEGAWLLDAALFD